MYLYKYDESFSELKHLLIDCYSRLCQCCVRNTRIISRPRGSNWLLINWHIDVRKKNVGYVAGCFRLVFGFKFANNFCLPPFVSREQTTPPTRHHARALTNLLFGSRNNLYTTVSVVYCPRRNLILGIVCFCSEPSNIFHFPLIFRCHIYLSVTEPPCRQ